MKSGWLLADGEAVASAAGAPRSPLARHDAASAARRGELAAVLRGPSLLLGPLDVVRVRGGTATSIRTIGRRPVCLLGPGAAVVVARGDAERCGLRRGATVELRWAR